MPKRNVYFSNDDVEIWDNLPDGMRSQLLRNLLIEFENNRLSELTDREKEREHLRMRVMRLKNEVYSLEQRSDELADRAIYVLEELGKTQIEYEEKFDAWNEDENLLLFEDIWDTIYSEAESRIGAIFTSPSGSNQYRIQGVKKGKVMVERMDTPSPKPSTFTSRTIEKAVERLNRYGDGERIERGRFMPVLAQECAAVFLHPSMRYEGNWLVFDRKDR